MFESNFPIDAAACTYRVLWNAFKRLVAGASAWEKAALFGGTAAKVAGRKYLFPANDRGFESLTI